MPPPLQFQPVLPVKEDSVWARMDSERRYIEKAFKEACTELRIEAYVGRSNSLEFPANVYFEAWVPRGNCPHLTDRLWTRVTIEAKPHHYFILEYHIEVHNRGRNKDWGRYGSFGPELAKGIVAHLVFKEPKPRLPGRIGIPGGLENEITVTKYRGLFENLSSLKPISIIFPAVCFGLAVGTTVLDKFVVAASLTIVGIALWIPLWIVRSHLPRVARTAGKPEKEPRSLIYYDSWQAVISGAGASRSTLYDRFTAILRNTPIKQVRHYIERIQYRALEMFDERDQIVVTANRGIMYFQIYEFGADLYIGWQSFLNRGSWIEQSLTHAADLQTGKLSDVRTIVPGEQPVSEYDLIDLNCLTEWTHTQLANITKQIIAELQIDQEIDFKIVRSERRGMGTKGHKKSRESFTRTG